MGVGGITTQSPHRIFSIRLPLGSGNDAILTGACMERITETFPLYTLKGKIEGEIKNVFLQCDGKVEDLPKLMATVGGNTDFMIGVKYLRYFSKRIFQMDSGLTIYRSAFKNADRSYGIVGGPHKLFSQIEKTLSQKSQQFCVESVSAIYNWISSQSRYHNVGLCRK